MYGLFSLSNGSCLQGAHIGNLANPHVSDMIRESDNAVNRLTRVISDSGGVYLDSRLPNFWYVIFICTCMEI